MELAVALVLALAVLAFGLLHHRRARRREEAAYTRCLAAQDHARQRPTAQLGMVTVVSQRRKSGTRAIVAWSDSRHRQDIWFHGNWPRAGSLVMVEPGTLESPTEDGPAVLYLQREQLLEVIPPPVMKPALRHQKRLERAERRPKHVAPRLHLHHHPGKSTALRPRTH